MRYIKPSILKTADAVAFVQQIGSADNSNKICDVFFDCGTPFIHCTQAAYEADE